MSTCSKLAYVAFLLAAGQVVAQRPDNVITVMTFRTVPASERELGANAAASLRDRLTNDFSSRQLTVRTTEQVLDFLDQSGFLDESKIPDPLDPGNEYLLAKQFSADFWVTGEIVDKNGNYRISPVLVLTRDPKLQQPLPVQTSDNVDDAMKNVSHSLRDALRQIQGERKCIGNYNARKVKEAIAAANDAIKSYPNATIARLCLQSVYFDMYRNATTHADSTAYADSTLAVASQVLRIDSLNALALQTSVPLYKARGDTVNWLKSVMRLALTSAPGDTKTLQEVVNELAGAGHFPEAQQLVKTLLEKSSGDAAALKLAFQVYAGAHNWPLLVATGPQLIQADSMQADSTYFLTMALAYDSLQQAAPETELLAEATAHLPKNANLWYLYSRALTKQGQIQQAQIALNTAIKLDPATYGLLLFKPVKDFHDAKQYDSAYSALSQAVVSGADTATAAKLALAYGGELLQLGSQAKDNTLLQQSVKFSTLSNRLAPSAKAEYFTGAAGYQMMDAVVRTIEKSKSCTDAQLANASYGIAQPALTAAAKAQEGAAAQMLELFPQYRKAIDSYLKAYCK